jgi:hypothetical protein
MKELDRPALLRLQAAQGWVELGNPGAASEELEEISPDRRAHPQVLQVRREVYAAAGRWDAALDIARALVKLTPDDPVGWIHQSYALHVLASRRSRDARFLPSRDWHFLCSVHGSVRAARAPSNAGVRPAPARLPHRPVRPPGWQARSRYRCRPRLNRRLKFERQTTTNVRRHVEAPAASRG